MGLYRKAIAAYNPDDVQLYHKALEIAPNDAGLYVKLANALVRQNGVDGAIGLFLRCWKRCYQKGDTNATREVYRSVSRYSGSAIERRYCIIVEKTLTGGHNARPLKFILCSTANH